MFAVVRWAIDHPNDKDWQGFKNAFGKEIHFFGDRDYNPDSVIAYSEKLVIGSQRIKHQYNPGSIEVLGFGGEGFVYRLTFPDKTIILKLLHRFTASTAAQKIALAKILKRIIAVSDTEIHIQTYVPRMGKIPGALEFENLEAVPAHFVTDPQSRQQLVTFVNNQFSAMQQAFKRAVEKGIISTYKIQDVDVTNPYMQVSFESPRGNEHHILVHLDNILLEIPSAKIHLNDID